MDQGVGVHHLHGAGERQGQRRVPAAQAAGLQRQHRPDPLPAGQQGVLHGLLQVGIAGQALKHPGQVLLADHALQLIVGHRRRDAAGGVGGDLIRVKDDVQPRVREIPMALPGLCRRIQEVDLHDLLRVLHPAGRPARPLRIGLGQGRAHELQELLLGRLLVVRQNILKIQVCPAGGVVVGADDHMVGVSGAHIVADPLKPHTQGLVGGEGILHPQIHAALQVGPVGASHLRRIALGVLVQGLGGIQKLI